MSGLVLTRRLCYLLSPVCRTSIHVCNNVNFVLVKVVSEIVLHCIFLYIVLMFICCYYSVNVYLFPDAKDSTRPH